MEHSHRRSPLGALSRVSRRVREVSQNFAHRRRVHGALLLLTSLVFGIWASDAAEKQATRAWLTNHPPSAEVWKHALMSRGYRVLEKPGQLHRVLRSIPTQTDENHTAWIEPHGLWIALFERQNDHLTPAIYCLECQTQATTWRRLGIGWEGFELALPALDLALASHKNRMQRPKTAIARDLREIDY